MTGCGKHSSTQAARHPGTQALSLRSIRRRACNPTPSERCARSRRVEWATGRLDEPLTVEDLAVHAGCSARTLPRRFTEQLGTSPGRWLLAQRMASAEEAG
ncbi:AraC family transcriptional regulator [Streptomyces sp. DH18]|uniref:AraC family transcriptional regulator n=1 Tax=Streptomyces sp. DH18 TaxID=3040126 RepID=UPI003FA6DE1D